METLLFVGLVLAAALACPLMMLWQSRRGGTAAGCCAPQQAKEEQPSLEKLRAHRQELTERIAELERRATTRA